MKKNGQMSDCGIAQQGEHIKARGILSYIGFVINIPFYGTLLVIIKVFGAFLVDISTVLNHVFMCVFFFFFFI